MNPERGLDLGREKMGQWCSVMAAEMTMEEKLTRHGRKEGERWENQENDPNEERG